MFEEAIKAAAEADFKLETTPELCGVLHGIPISLKDQIATKGYNSSTGVVSHMDTIETEDALIA
jgi:amidase